MEKKIYRNGQDDIGFEFTYEDEDDLRNNFEGLVFELLSFIAEYGMEEELIDSLENPTYYIGDDFKAEIVEDMDEYLGNDWYKHLGK